MDHRIAYKGTEIFYRTHGKGKPLVFIHGFAEDATIFSNQISYFEKDYYVIVPDLPGSGQSAFNGSISTIEGYAQSVLAVLDAEKIQQSTVIGHSMGGYITLAIADKNPERLDTLGLFHSSAYADDDEKKKARNKSIDFINDHGAAKFLEESIPKLFAEKFRKENPEKVNEIVKRYAGFEARALVQYTKAMMQRPDRTSVLKSWKKPVLMIIGEEDSAIPFQLSLQQSHLPTLCYIHIAKQTGHMGMIEESTSCNKIILDFLEDQ
jgi:pimeloyl-ACP methyl ester carboxylesterase